MENSAMDIRQDAMAGAPPEGSPQDNAEDAGRGTDTVMAHLSLGEVVIPRSFLDDPQVMQALQMIFRDGGADMAEFTVGDAANKINPETGYAEFGFKKFFRRIAPFVAPALSIFAPGIGTALGGALLGANAVGASTLGSALIGGGLGAATGGGKGALIGAGLGAVGANLGDLPGAALADGVQGPVQAGSGILGQVGSATGLTQSSLPSLSGLTGSSGGGNSLSATSLGANALGGFQQDAALKKQRQQLLAAQRQQLSNLDNLNPVDVQNDPGYQFNLEQGQRGLDRSAAAAGGLFSGAQLKAASQYNQDFANNYYNQAYSRQAAKIGAQNDIYGNRGNILGNSTLARSNNINQALSNAFGSNIGGYGGLTNGQLLELLRQRGLR